MMCLLRRRWCGGRVSELLLSVLFNGMNRYPPIKYEMPVNAFCGEIAEGDLQMCAFLRW